MNTPPLPAARPPTQPPRPVGFLGGSFDPVHAGHVQLGRDACAALGLREIVFLPAGQPWQKPSPSAASDRLHMLGIALEGWEGARIDRREIERAGPTYTYDTLQELRAEAGAGAPLVWILGEDQLARLDTWHRWEELAHLAHLAFARRPGSAAAPSGDVARMLRDRRGTVADLTRQAAGVVVEFPMRAVDCSSSELRASLARTGEPIAPGLLADGVLSFIRSRNLYGGRHGPA